MTYGNFSRMLPNSSWPRPKKQPWRKRERIRTILLRYPVLLLRRHLPPLRRPHRRIQVRRPGRGAPTHPEAIPVEVEVAEAPVPIRVAVVAPRGVEADDRHLPATRRRLVVLILDVEGGKAVAETVSVVPDPYHPRKRLPRELTTTKSCHL